MNVGKAVVKELASSTLPAFFSCVDKFHQVSRQAPRSDKVVAFQKMRVGDTFIAKGNHIAISTPQNSIWFATFLELWDYIIAGTNGKEYKSQWLHVKLWKKTVFDNVQCAVILQKVTLDYIPVGFNYNIVRDNLLVAEDQIIDDVSDLINL